MRLLKLGLISIVAFALLLFLLSLLFPSNIRISRAINIHTTKQKVQQQVGHISQWQYWNEMVNDTGLTNKKYSDSSFSADQVRVNLVYAFPDSVKTTWKNKSRNTTGVFNMIQATPDTTIVQWYFDFRLQYPWEKFGSIVLDKQMGPSMEKSLTNLKNLLENNP